MKSPVYSIEWFKNQWQEEWEEFLKAYQPPTSPGSGRGEPVALKQDRFLRRSILPHVENLSEHFNRLASAGSDHGIPKYWKKSSNNFNQLLAYASYFAPQNAMRMAAVLHEAFSFSHYLGTAKGEEKTSKDFQALEFGAGTGAAALGLGLVIQHFLKTREGGSDAPRMFENFSITQVESNRQALHLAKEFLNRVTPHLEVRPYHSSLAGIESLKDFNTKFREQFDLWISSFFLNELDWSPETAAHILIRHWKNVLKPGALICLVEPALMVQSRRLLELRRCLIESDDVEIIKPCLDNRSCGALIDAKDWCHERIAWWRPRVIQTIDDMTGLDHKELSFSYLTLRLKRGEKTIQPKMGRLISEVKFTKQAPHAFVCFEDGKKYVRFSETGFESELMRGSEIEVIEGSGSKDSFHAKKWRL